MIEDWENMAKLFWALVAIAGLVLLLNKVLNVGEVADQKEGDGPWCI